MTTNEFEKARDEAAEKKIKDLCEYGDEPDLELVENVFKDGANFGYKFAQKEIEKLKKMACEVIDREKEIIRLKKLAYDLDGYTIHHRKSNDLSRCFEKCVCGLKQLREEIEK
jgi:hypothetical protein